MRPGGSDNMAAGGGVTEIIDCNERSHLTTAGVVYILAVDMCCHVLIPASQRDHVLSYEAHPRPDDVLDYIVLHSEGIALYVLRKHAASHTKRRFEIERVGFGPGSR